MAPPTLDGRVTHTRATPTLGNLPPELFWQITECLESDSLGALRCVSKELKAKTTIFWLCRRLYPLAIRVDPEDPGRVYLLPDPYAPGALPGQYHALQCARQLILQTSRSSRYDSRPGTTTVTELCLIALSRILHNNLVPQALKLQALTLCATHSHEGWPDYYDDYSVFAPQNPFNLAGLPDKFSAHWGHLTQLIIYIPAAKNPSRMLSDLVTRCILPHAPRLEDFRYFDGPFAVADMGRVLWELALIDPRPPLKRLEVNGYGNYWNLIDLAVVLQVYGRTLETVTVLNPFPNRPQPDDPRLLQLKAACPAVVQLLGHVVFTGRVRWAVLSGPAELYEQRPRDDDGSLEWVRVDGAAEWKTTFTHVRPL